MAGSWAPGCSSTTSSEEHAAASVSVAPPTLVLNVGASQQLKSVVYDVSNAVIVGAPLTYKSEDSTVARVSAAGNVTGIAAGLTSITVSSGAAATSVGVHIMPPPARITVTPSSVRLGVGHSLQLRAVAYDSSNAAIPGSPLTFTSADTAVATVSSGGNVTAIGKGLTSLTVASAPASATVSIDVVAGAASIHISPDSVVLTGSQTVLLTAIAIDSVGDTVSATINFASSDTSIASASATGLVTPRQVGTAYIVATTGSVRDSARVTALLARVLVPGYPFATGITSSGAGFVTQLDISQVQPLDVAAPGTSGSPIRVGLLPSAIAPNAAGTLAYVVNQGEATVSVISTSADSVVGTIALPGPLLSALVAPGDSLLLVGTDEGSVFVVRLATSTVVDSFPATYTTWLAMLGDSIVFANEVLSSAIVEYNLHSRQVVRTLQVGGTPLSMMASLDGATLYVANDIGQLQFWSLATGALETAVTLPGGGGFALARNPRNGLLYVSTTDRGWRVHVIDPGTRSIVRQIFTGGTPCRISFTSDGSVGIVANDAGWVDYIR